MNIIGEVWLFYEIGEGGLKLLIGENTSVTLGMAWPLFELGGLENFKQKEKFYGFFQMRWFLMWRKRCYKS